MSDDERTLLSVCADEFHAALARGGVGDWGPFLAGLPEQLRPAVLAELVSIDLTHRYERGERPKVEEYVRRFPDLGPTDRVPQKVIVEEFRSRVKVGERPDPANFQSRFPSQFGRIRTELEGLLPPPEEATEIGTLATPDGGAAFARSQAPGGGATDYEFIRTLGRGVFGEVWLARKNTSGIEKAIKILLHAADRDASDRERRSLELIKNLRHPYLLATEDFWVSDNRLHIVMELADCTLRNRLQKCREESKPGIPADELLGYLWEAAEGLDFLHSRHITHRDVKADNILLLHGHAKVADFGLARYQEEVLAPMGTLAGTPAYMAPEVWGKEAGPASDQYSLAIVYAELRQGRLPLKGGGLHEMLSAHQEGTFDLSSFISGDERAALVKALAKKPEDRFPSCRAFVEALGVALGRPGTPRSGQSFSTVPNSSAATPTDVTQHDATLIVPPPAPPLPPIPALAPTAKPAKNRKVMLASALVVVLVTGGGFGIWKMFGTGGHSSGGTSPGTEPGAMPSEPRLPAKAARAADARELVLADGRKVYEWITLPIGGETVRFRSILAGQGPRPVEPFYMMDSKVWNSLYRAGGGVLPPGSDANGPDAPVTGATAEEAARFAATALGGKLPTPDEWDHAAGFYPPPSRAEVTRYGGRPRVLLARPEATHGPNAGSDVNEFGLRDMAGNGREWTRVTLASPGVPAKVVGADAVSATDLVILRGRNFTLSRGLTFEMLEYEQKTPQTQYATARSPYTGFRVMLPIP